MMELEDYEDYFIDHPHELSLEDAQFCASQIGRQVLKDLVSLIIYNLTFRLIIFITQNVKLLRSLNLEPIISTIFGVFLLYAHFTDGFLHVFSFIMSSFVVFKILFHSKFLGYYMEFFCIVTLVVWELVTTDSTTWHKIRGIQMVAAMKIISISFDQSTEGVGKVSLQNYLGYIFCPATLIYGPWISYKDHVSTFLPRSFRITRNLKWVLANSLIAMIFILSMNCFFDFVVPDSYPKWIVAYRAALSFRSSHYFISFMSQAVISAAGMSSPSSNILGEQVTKPLDVEIPRSLNVVVTSWNIPMHLWLKKYVFSKLVNHNTFFAVLVTYIISSLLHGLSLQIYAVLVSLAFYTFVEHRFRKKLSERLNLCIKVGRCRNCCHRRSHFATILNILFGILAVWHLAYLGLMFDFSNTQEEGYSLWHTLEKWRALNYLSHWVVLGTFFVTLVL
ncbi:PORCN family protein [Megaselia abdita]